MRALGVSAVLLVLACAAKLQATTLLHLNLPEMVARADKIFRGTVVEVGSDTVHVSGIDVPTVRYTLQVDESFTGEYTEVKGQRFVEIQMIGTMPPVQVGNAVRMSPLPDMPTLDKGDSYLLFTTLPSQTGLSAPVGLGQGWFRLYGDAGEEEAVNGFDNVGLFCGTSVQSMPRRGPIAYTELAEQIRAVLDKR